MISVNKVSSPHETIVHAISVLFSS